MWSWLAELVSFDPVAAPVLIAEAMPTQANALAIVMPARLGVIMWRAERGVREIRSSDSWNGKF